MDLRHVRDVAGISYLEARRPGGRRRSCSSTASAAARRAFTPATRHFGRDYRADRLGHARLCRLRAAAAGHHGRRSRRRSAASSRRSAWTAPSSSATASAAWSCSACSPRRPHAARAVVLAQTSAVFGSRDPAWAEQFIEARLGPLDAGKSMADIAAPAVARHDRRGRGRGRRAARDRVHGRRARQHVSRHGARHAGLRPARERCRGSPRPRWCWPAVGRPERARRAAWSAWRRAFRARATSCSRASATSRYAEQPAAFNAAVEASSARPCVERRRARPGRDNDAPIFDPRAFRLDAEQAALLDRVRHLAATRFAPRAAEHDRDATFPTENYRDLRDAGLLAICIPRAQAGSAPSYRDLLPRRRGDRPLLRRDRADLEHARLLHALEPARSPTTST